MSSTAMNLAPARIVQHCEETEIYSSRLSFDGAKVLDLGCGAAAHSIAIASAHPNCQITAMEVDERQHRANLAKSTPTNVSFREGGAQSLFASDNTFDIVMMFKSLHHVPVELMGTALGEIHRVLKPGGYAYVSEPIFAGEFNDIIRAFHDEQAVRMAAFEAINDAVTADLFLLAEEIFFNAPVHFDNFGAFEKQMINATHTEHVLSEDVYHQVRQALESHQTDQGINFSAPMRVDLLQKPA